MDYDIVEGLNDEQIKELYSDIMEFGENNFISTNTIWFLNCDNGKRGSILDKNFINYSGIGYGFYEFGHPNTGAFDICGTGRWGYTQIIGYNEDGTYGTIWRLNCNNGKTGYINDNNFINYMGIGYGFYEHGVSVSLGMGAFYVCGSNEWGYTRIVTYW